ncbi:MAG: minor capsid protein [Lachnospiraceae bacterium]
MSVQFKWNKPIPQISKEAWGGNRTLLFMATEAKRLMDPYVPARDLKLASNVRTYVEGNSGIVHYVSPYANFQWGGLVMVSRITGSPYARRGESKVLTDRALSHSGGRHPLATKKWNEAMKRDRMGDYTSAVQNFVGGKG